MTEQPRAWWRDAVIYQVYVRSFADSDGDGIGDIPGIRSRLPYLRDLGVDAVWLTPFYPSPQADGGYDVADYRDVDPLFGSLGDMDALIGDAHGLGLRVLVDIVPNHTSNEHAWFRAALAAGPGSPERARYVFRHGLGPDGEQPPSDWLSVFGGRAWERVDDGEWYLHLFAPEQPDLNWDNPEVRAEFLDILRFWLDRGIDGIRIDVANALTKDLSHPLRDLGLEAQDPHAEVHGGPDHPFWDRDEVHDVYLDWRVLLDSYEGDRMSVAEAWVQTPERRARYVRGDGLHQAFNFHLVRADFDAMAFRKIIDEEIGTMAMVGADPTWVLSNHDVVREVTRYGDGDAGLQRARAALMLVLALPGSAYVYQGEELGLPEVTDLPDDVLQDPTFFRTGGKVRGRDGCRVPIPWGGTSPPYAFGPNGSTPWLPQPAAWADLSVDALADDPTSMLSMTRSALQHRRSVVGLPLEWVDDLPDEVLGLRRGDGFVCLVNFGGQPASVPDIDLVPVLSSDPTYVVGGPLPPRSAVWLTSAG